MVDSNRSQNVFKRLVTELPVRKKLLGMIFLYSFIIAGLLLISYVEMNFLSGVRGYVGAEGTWSKGQKDAVYNLSRYAYTREEAYYQKFLQSLKVPLADRRVRLELEKTKPDFHVAYQGFIEGHVHPADVNMMTILFRQFRNLYYIDKAVTIWAEGDSLIDELQVSAAALHQEISSGRSSSERADETLKNIEAVNEKLTRLEDAFSLTLGEASRWLKGLLQQAMFWTTVFFFLIGLWFSLLMARHLSDGIFRLREGAIRVSKGDFSRRIVVESKDELGDLATALSSEYGYLTEMAAVAEKIAEGNFSVSVVPRSAEDRFGHAFKKMIENLKTTADLAEEIAKGNLTVTLALRSTEDRFGNAFKKMIDHLKGAADVAQNIAKGNLRVNVTPRSAQDSFGAAFKKMIGDLSEMAARVQSTAEQVSLSGNEVSAATGKITAGAEVQSVSSGEISSMMIEMASQIESISRLTQILEALVGEVSASMNELGASLQEVSQHTNHLSDSTGRASGAFEETAHSIRQVVDGVREVDMLSSEATRFANENGEKLVRIVGDIGQRSLEIRKVVKLIDELSNQTDLLALNASIQAAQAGEAGRSFNVVAEEVKELAKQSRESAKIVAEEIGAVHQRSQEAIELGENILTQIIASSANVSKKVSEIHQAMEAQSQAVSQVLGLAQEMAQLAGQVDLATNEQTKTIRAVLKSVETMNQMTRQVTGATAEQDKAAKLAVKEVERIAEIAKQNFDFTLQLSQAAQRLIAQAEHLQLSTRVFAVQR